MSKILDEPIAVSFQKGRLVAFRHRVRYQVHQVLDFWREAGDWWQGDSERSVYRVETDRGIVCEVYVRHQDSRWFLYKVYD